jgi:hypothetical protein
MEQNATHPYRVLLNSEQMHRIYLDELGAIEDLPLGVAAIALETLLKMVQLPLIELWLGLLLGGYEMRREVVAFERDEDFYSVIGILVEK